VPLIGIWKASTLYYKRQEYTTTIKPALEYDS